PLSSPPHSFLLNNHTYTGCFLPTPFSLSMYQVSNKRTGKKQTIFLKKQLVLKEAVEQMSPGPHQPLPAYLLVMQDKKNHEKNRRQKALQELMPAWSEGLCAVDGLENLEVMLLGQRLNIHNQALRRADTA
uniref:Uncharacterized protein n=1 Tax=Coturnix japonica TaxID=93934 RepID=A0A8C2TZ50_COTJA